MAEKPGGGKPGDETKSSTGKTKVTYGDPKNVINITKELIALGKVTLLVTDSTHKLGEQASESYDLAAKAAKYFEKNLNKLSESFEEQKEKLEDLSEAIEEQVSIWKKIEKSAGNVTGRFDKITSSISKIGEQSENITKLSESFKSVDVSAKTASDGVKGLSNAIKQQEKALAAANKEAGFKKGGDGKNNVLEQVAKSSKSAKVGVTALGGAFNLLGKAIKGITSIFGGMFDILSSVFGAAKSIIGGIIGFVSDLFGTMVEMSNEVKERMLEQAQALEKVKEVFGDTSRGAAADVKSFVSASMNLYSPGSLSQIFGSYTEAADFARGLVESSAEMSTLLSSQLKESSVSIVKFAKGLGMAADDFKAVMDMSYATGESIIDLQKSIGKFSQGLASRLGLNAKVLSKNILIAAKDVKHFGTASVKAMAESAAYANKMGVSLDKIVGVLDKFDTFESAAESVSKLSQAFGVNLDTMKLVEAETPEERMEMLKDSFAAAGKSLDSLSRRELSYAASLIGTDEATVKNMLSNKNQANSLNDIKDASSAVEKQTRSTADVLAESMKGVAMQLQNIQNSSKGFFDRFLDGIFEGILMSGPMQKVLGNLAQALDKVFMAGKQLGAAFVATFPGVKKMIDALASFFDPAKIGGLFNGFTSIFETFFKKLQNGTGDVKNLFSDLFAELKTFFLKESPAGKQFLDGISEFWKAVSTIIATGITALGDMLGDALTSIANDLSKPPELPGAKKPEEKTGIVDTGKKVVESIQQSPIAQASIKAFEKIKEPLLIIFSSIWDKMLTAAGEKLSAFFSEYKWEIALAGFGYALLKIGGLALSNPELTKGLMSGLSSFTSSFSKLFGAGGPISLGLVGAVGAAVASVTLAVDQASKLIDENKDLIDQLKRAGRDTNENEATKTENLRNEAKNIAAQNKLSADERRSKYSEALGSTNKEFGVSDELKAGLLQAYDAPLESLLGTVTLGLIPGIETAGMKANTEIANSIAVLVDRRNESIAAALKENPEDLQIMRDLQKTQVDNLTKNLSAGQMEAITSLESHFRDTGELLDFNVAELESGVMIDGKEFSLRGQHDVIRAFLEKRQQLALESLTPEQLQKSKDDLQKQLQDKQAKEAEEAGKKMMQETMDSMGITTVDNVEERIKKIEEIGAKISGGKEKFQQNMKKIKEDLASYNFTLFDKPEDLAKFQTMLGQSTALVTFSQNMDKVFVSMEQFGNRAAGIGTAKDENSIVGKFVSGLDKLQNGFKDINSAMSRFVNEQSLSMSSDVPSNISDWTSKTETMFDSLGRSLNKMNSSFTVIDEIKKKITSITELRQELDAAMQSLSDSGEQKVTVSTSAPDSKGAVAAKPQPEKIKTSMGVNMTLKFDIIMDSKSLEKSIVTRSDSIVLNALKLMAEGTNKIVQESPGHNVFVTNKQ